MSWFSNLFTIRQTRPAAVAPGAPKTISGGQPRGRPVRMFEALVDFDCPETGSTYVKGHFYTLREGNPGLASRAARWKAEGKVAYVSHS